MPIRRFDRFTHAILLSVLAFVLYLTIIPARAAAAQPWWRTYTTMVSHPQDLKDLREVNAGAFRGVGYFGGWYGSWYYDHQLATGRSQRPWDRVTEAGARHIIYYDLGEVGDFAGFFTKDGKMAYDAWSIPWWKGEPVTARWFGLAAFIANVPWAPYPTAKDLGFQPFTMPDGSAPTDLYDLLWVKNLRGDRKLMESSNARVTDEIAAKTGLASISNKQTSAPNIVGRTGWITARIDSLDYSNPQLIDYVTRDVARYVRKVKPQGFHFDNFGDLNLVYPYSSAFGIWSRYTYRQFMKKHFTAKQLAAMGIDDIDTFDIAHYILSKPMGQVTYWQRLQSPSWTTDPVWTCYLINKVETSLAYHRAVYETVKKVSREEGFDCAVTGNAIPLFPGGAFLKGTCDIANFEWQSNGTYTDLAPAGLPPTARFGYVCRMGAAFSEAGYCWPTLYVTKDYAGKGHDELYKVLSFECLANRGLMDFNYQYLDHYCPGTPPAAGFVNGFVEANADRLTHRRYAADVALVYSDWTNVASTAVHRVVGSMFLDEYSGWADFLEVTHRQWDVLLAQDLTFANLRKYPVVVLPSIMVMTANEADALRQYIAAGGHIVATGETGTRFGPDGYLLPRPQSLLVALDGSPNVHITTDRPGVTYRRQGRPADTAHTMAQLLTFAGVSPIVATDAPDTVGVNVNTGAGEFSGTLTIDLNNLNLDPATDTVTDAPACDVTVRLPHELAGASLAAFVITPDGNGGSQRQPLAIPHPAQDRDGTTLTLHVPGFRYYTVAVVEKARHGKATAQ